MIRPRTRKPRGLEPLAAKVPEITVLFWIIKVLTTGMGESMSDFLGQQSVPLAGAIGILGLAYALRLQLRTREYRAPVYWLTVMMVAVFGTMAADGIHDGAGLSYAVTTPFFGAVSPSSSGSGIAARARSTSTASAPDGARPTTGSPCSPPSRSAPRRAT